MLLLAAALFTALLITYLAIPSIIRVAKIKDLFDEPGERKNHSTSVPTLGGIAIFAGFLLSATFWIDPGSFSYLKYLYVSLFILFFVGLKDDIILIDPIKKFGLQIFAAFILVYWGEVRLTSLYGIFGISQLPYWVSIGLSLFTVLVITNAYNLIDGINGLAGSVGLLFTITFGIWFHMGGIEQYAILSFCMAGALVAFLKFNLTPTSIFMGDTGSLVIGFTTSLLAIQFIELHNEFEAHYQIANIPAVTIAILIIPLYDILQVFITRVLQKRSPFKPDMNHVHFQVLRMGFSHLQTTSILLAVNIVIILLAIWLQRISYVGTSELIIIIFGLCFCLMLIPMLTLKYRGKIDKQIGKKTPNTSS